MAKSARRHVALLIETSNAYARGLLFGIRAYMREHESWSIYVGEQTRGDPAPAWLKQWDGDGIIARIENQRIADSVLESGLPAVDVSAARLVAGVPYVETDDPAIAEMGAEHLLERGFEKIAFCGVPQFRWSDNRRERFVEFVAERGYQSEAYPNTSKAAGAKSWEQEREHLTQWIADLPKPIGILAAYDIRGRQVLDVCRELGIDVPSELAVLGIDDDELVCELADPPLSSIVLDSQGAGYEAARLLDEMMAGRDVEPTAHLLKPLGVEIRQSTDVLATDDVELAAAIRFIRENACEGIRVSDVLAQVPLSRRVLEMRFKELMERTPHEEIIRVQIARVKELLLQSDLPLRTIARLAGFKHVEYMSVVFKRVTGQPPGQYRATGRRDGGGGATLI
jgi:LacI family transcriptional regulator